MRTLVSSVLPLFLPMFLALGLNGCSPVQPTPERACETALECASVRATTDITCKVPHANVTDQAFSLFNNHQSKKIYVSYEQYVRHINSTEQDQRTTKMVEVGPGKLATLGCKRTKGILAEQYNEWSYTIVAACFAESCPSAPPSKPEHERDPLATCDQLCDEQDSSCLQAVVAPPITTQLRRDFVDFNARLVRNPLPTRISLKPFVDLANATGGPAECVREPLEISAPSPVSSNFVSTGSSCRVNLNVATGNFDQLGIDFPGEWSGKLERTTSSYVMAAKDEVHTPILSIRSSDTGKWSSDPIAMIQGEVQSSRGKMTFTAQHYYCVRLIWEGDKIAKSQKKRR